MKRKRSEVSSEQLTTKCDRAEIECENGSSSAKKMSHPPHQNGVVALAALAVGKSGDARRIDHR